MRKVEDVWQITRIGGEFAKGFDTFNEIDIPCVSVFGSARKGLSKQHYKDAEAVGRLLVEAGFGVITGGGPGIMEAANKGAYETEEGTSVGIGIELPFEASMNPYINLGVENRYFFTRKVMFLKYSQAFIVFPGGLGTLDELFEALTLAQTGHNVKYPIILYGTKFWKGLLNWLQETPAAWGCISQKDFDLFRLVDTPEEAVAKIKEYHDKYSTNETNF